MDEYSNIVPVDWRITKEINMFMYASICVLGTSSICSLTEWRSITMALVSWTLKTESMISFVNIYICGMHVLLVCVHKVIDRILVWPRSPPYGFPTKPIDYLLWYHDNVLAQLGLYSVSEWQRSEQHEVLFEV